MNCIQCQKDSSEFEDCFVEIAYDAAGNKHILPKYYKVVNAKAGTLVPFCGPYCSLEYESKNEVQEG